MPFQQNVETPPKIKFALLADIENMFVKIVTGRRSCVLESKFVFATLLPYHVVN